MVEVLLVQRTAKELRLSSFLQLIAKERTSVVSSEVLQLTVKEGTFVVVSSEVLQLTVKERTFVVVSSEALQLTSKELRLSFF